MKKLYISLFISIFFTSLLVQGQLIAFPTAEGAGKYTSGGRGTISTAPTIYEVTTLVDNSSSANTPGTFRYACTKSGAASRIIVFRVSGTIHLYASLSINRGNTTIAGQTAPGAGICLADYPVQISSNNVIIRYIRFRLGDKNQAASLGNDDALGGVGYKKIIIDHCTTSWSNDEACTFYNGDSLTLQWNVISEPLDSSYHDEGSGVQQHGYGGIWGGKHATFHHNLFAHCRGRMARFAGIRDIPADTGDFRNNVIYNWASYNLNGGEGGTYNVVNNYYKYGLNTLSTTTSGINRRNMILNPGKQATPVLPYAKYYLTGNYCNNSTVVTNSNWKGVAFDSGSPADSVNSKVTTPFNCININMQSATDAYEAVLAGSGCVLPVRDTLDERIMNDVKNRTGRVINVQGGFTRGTPYSITQTAWPTLLNGTAQTDTDHDGMPDNWETARGLTIAVNDANGYISTSGYPNIENYINGDTIVAVGKAQNCVTAKKITAANSGQWLFSRDSSNSYYLSTSYTSSTDSNHIVAGLLDDANYGTFNVSYYTTNITRVETISNKPYLNRNITIVPAIQQAFTTPVTVKVYISKAEFNLLKAADASISTIADIVILKTTDNNCTTNLSGAYEVLLPTASGVFGTYNNGYYLQFQTQSFGTFFFAGKLSFPVPLKLISFNAVLNNRKEVYTNWITNNEVNSNKFEILRSNNQYNFYYIGEIEATNLSGTNNYHFIDKNPIDGISYYKLKMLDKDGRFAYSSIVKIINNKKQTLLVSPNPVKNNLSVIFTPITTASTLKILNAVGIEMNRYILKVGSNKLAINTFSLPAGMYEMILVSGSNFTTTRFIKE